MYESISLLLAAIAGISAPTLLPTSPALQRSGLEAIVAQTIPTSQQQSRLEPFLTLPLQKPAATNAGVSPNEGWYYSPGEMAIHDKALHRGIDWPVARGTPVLAASDGYAVRSFQLAGTDEVHQGKSVGFSLGEFVEIWHPDQGLYTLYGHLERASDTIPYVLSEELAPSIWEPTGIYVDSSTFVTRAVKVERGDIIGYAGDSGIGWGYSDTFDATNGHVEKRDYRKFPSWDETHIHFEVYNRTPDGRFKDTRFDPFGLYDYIDGDRNYYSGTLTDAAPSLWLTDDNGLPRYSSER